MLDDMQFLEINDGNEGESDQEMLGNGEEAELFRDLQEKFSQRPDLFNFGGYTSHTQSRSQHDMIIGLHKGLRQAYFQLTSDNKVSQPFIEAVKEVSEYLEICHSQIESHDYRDVAEFEAFFEQLIKMGFNQLKESNKHKKKALDQAKDQLF